jgi:hypothetical protein
MIFLGIIEVEPARREALWQYLGAQPEFACCARTRTQGSGRPGPGGHGAASSAGRHSPARLLGPDGASGPAPAAARGVPLLVLRFIPFNPFAIPGAPTLL